MKAMVCGEDTIEDKIGDKIGDKILGKIADLTAISHIKDDEANDVMRLPRKCQFFLALISFKL